MTDEHRKKIEGEAQQRLAKLKISLDDQKIIDYINGQLASGTREEADERLLRSRRDEIIKQYERAAHRKENIPA